MGRRYGRNQKRKHRERIAELESQAESRERALQGAEYLANRMAHDLASIHAEINRLTPYSAFLPPKVLRLDPDRFRWNSFRSQRPRVLMDLNPPGDPPKENLFLDVLDIPMFHVTSHIRQNPGSFETVVHFEVKSPTKVYSRDYFVSAEALCKDDGYGQIVERIVTTCIRELIEEFYKERKSLGV